MSTRAGSDPRLKPFDYALPADLIALYPPEQRDGGRLMFVPETAPPQCRMVTELPALLRAGDLLVLNDTRVFAARLRTRRETGGRVEVLLMQHADAEVEAMVRPGRRLKSGERLQLLDPHGEDVPGAGVTLCRPAADGAWVVRPEPTLDAVVEMGGELALPPYLHRPPERADRHRYQTVFAGPTGAVAAPTAGLHLTPDLIDAVRARGVRVAHLTLHVGAGTFRNLRPADLDAGQLHPERYVISDALADEVQATRAQGGRIVAVGTTSTRALESAADGRGGVRAGPGVTQLFIRPGDTFRVVDLLWTNFHLPCSSLLMLACAFGGTDRVLGAYGRAIDERFRFFSYGDAMLLTPCAPRGVRRA